jgi:hypothetical protein
MRPNVSDEPAENSSTLKMEAAGHCKTLADFWHAAEYRVKEDRRLNIHSCKPSYLMSWWVRPVV